MVARKRKKTPTKRKKNIKHRAVLSHFLGWAFFIALGYASFAGWWPHLIQGETNLIQGETKKHTAPMKIATTDSRSLHVSSAKIQSSEVNKPSQLPQQEDKRQKHDEIHDLIIVGSVVTPRLPNLDVVASPQTKPPVLAKIKTGIKTDLPPVPYKEDSSLPPEGQFGIDNAAIKVFAKDMLTVFAEKNNEAKIVATLPKGKEMRVYETDSDWRRIVVPSSDIIGWVMAQDVTANHASVP